MVTFRELAEADLIEVALWEHPELKGQCVNWVAYLDVLNNPRWVHLGVEWEGHLVAAVSLEDLGGRQARVHVSARRHAIHPAYLRHALCELARFLFLFDVVSAIKAVIPPDRRAARVLARSFPGMRSYGRCLSGDIFEVTKGDFFHVKAETSNGANSLSGANDEHLRDVFHRRHAGSQGVPCGTS